MQTAKLLSTTVTSSRSTLFRYYCSHPQDTVGPPGRLKRYLINKFVRMVSRSETFMETKNPAVFKVYKTFKEGFNGLMTETKSFYTISKEIWQGKELHTFSRRELVIYRQMPSQMLQAAPLIIVAVMPGGVFIFPTILPFVYLFPKTFLTHHFWTKDQKEEVYTDRHISRLKHMPSVVDHMEIQCKKIRQSDLKNKMYKILQKLEHSIHPTVEEILELKPIFETMNFTTERLSLVHARHIAKMFGFSLRRSKLVQEGLLLLHTDLAIVREGFGVMTEEEVDMACFMRGLNPYGLKRVEKEGYLKSWTEISKEVDEKSMSLLLHGPVFLALNLPTNRNLVGGKSFRWRRKR